MKKVLLFAALAVVFASCGGNHEETKTEGTETTAPAADTAATTAPATTDTAATSTETSPAPAGESH